jgi:hypothetical protein
MQLNPTKNQMGDIRLTNLNLKSKTATANVYITSGWSTVNIPVKIDKLLKYSGESIPDTLVVRY